MSDSDRNADPTGASDEKRALGLEQFQQPAEEGGLSLDQLSAAFAEMLGGGADPYATATAESEEPTSVAGMLATEGLATAGAVEERPQDDQCEVSPRTILEAMLFVGSPNNEPLTSERVASLMRGVSPLEVDELVQSLNEHYDTQHCAYRIVSDGAGYRLTLREELSRVRDKFHGRVKQARLSPAAVEVLALVAYNEPLTADQITQRRGTGCGAILSQLVRRQLLTVARANEPPRQSSYSTTPRFLKLFGLESLADLPRSQDLEPT